MGLDNGVQMKIKRNEKIPYTFVNLAVESFYSDEESNELVFDVLYWRKWWGMRNAFMNHLESKYGYDLGRYQLDTDDVTELIFIFDKYTDKDHWDNDYWEYEDNIEKIRHDIEMLKEIRFFMREHHDTPVRFEFYDSY